MHIFIFRYVPSYYFVVVLAIRPPYHGYILQTRSPTNPFSSFIFLINMKFLFSVFTYAFAFYSVFGCFFSYLSFLSVFVCVLRRSQIGGPNNAVSVLMCVLFLFCALRHNIGLIISNGDNNDGLMNIYLPFYFLFSSFPRSHQPFQINTQWIYWSLRALEYSWHLAAHGHKETHELQRRQRVSEKSHRRYFSDICESDRYDLNLLYLLFNYWFGNRKWTSNQCSACAQPSVYSIDVGRWWRSAADVSAKFLMLFSSSCWFVLDSIIILVRAQSNTAINWNNFQFHTF